MNDQYKSNENGTDLTKSIIPTDKEDTTVGEEKISHAGDGAYINLTYNDINFINAPSNDRHGKTKK